MVREALGVPENMGYSQAGHADHCVLPESQKPIVDAFVRKFLPDNASTDTVIMETDGGFDFETESWISWTVPDLE